MLAELEEVLSREKFSERLRRAAIQPADLVNGFAALANVVRPAVISLVVLRDPDDDAVIACAVTASAKVIVSGDDDLLTLKRYEGIDFLKASEFLARIQMIESGHRPVLPARLKKAGPAWRPDHADQLAHLRVLRANQQWESLWN